MPTKKGGPPNRELARLKKEVLAELNQIKRTTKSLELEIEKHKKRLLVQFNFAPRPQRSKR